MVVHSCGEIAGSLLDLGLVNELRLMIFPSVSGEGKHLLDGIEMHALELAELKPTAMIGVIVQIDKPGK